MNPSAIPYNQKADGIYERHPERNGSMSEKIKISFSANAGFSAVLPYGTVWIDALHDKNSASFSSVSPELWKVLRSDPDFTGGTGKGPDIIAFTHCHTDHFSSRMCREAKSIWPEARLILPENYFPGQLLLKEERHEVTAGSLRLEFVKARHSGRESGHNNYFINISYPGCSMLVSGDTSISDETFSGYAGCHDTDVAFMTFSWLLFKKGRDVIGDIIRPKHLMITHLPFASEDISGYGRAAAEGASKLKGIDDIRFLDTPFQKETIDI